MVQGTPASATGALVHHVLRQGRVSRVIPSPTENSQEARLRYRVLEEGDDRSLLQIFLETGRRHQIRIQLAAIGHPILGDLRYGAGRSLPESQVALLARRLSVDHPTRRTRLDLISPIPLAWPWPVEETFPGNRPPWDWRRLVWPDH